MQKNFLHKYTNDRSYRKVREHCHCIGKCRGAAYSIRSLKYSTPKEIPVVFDSRLSYDYHFITKVLAKKLEGKLNCLGENTEKYKTFSVAITKEVKRIFKSGKETTKNIS